MYSINPSVIGGEKIEIWKEIKRIRHTTGLSASLFGAAVGVSRISVMAWENARYLPTNAHILKIAALAPLPTYYGAETAKRARAKIENDLIAAATEEKLRKQQKKLENKRIS